MIARTNLKGNSIILIFLLVLIILGIQQAHARDVPFGDANTIDGDFDGASSVYAADVDGDGDMDVLGAGCAAYEITWWENTDSNGTAWSEHAINGSFGGAKSVYASDIDGDGDIDVLGAAQSAEEITWWENNNGSGTSWVEHTLDDTFVGAVSIQAADIDGDGDMDILGAAYLAVAWWENTAGNGTAWTKHTIIDILITHASEVYTADVDGDDDLDVLVADVFQFIYLENTVGDGTTWTKHIVDDAANGGASVYAADVDGDGDLDVLGADFSDDEITWWENTAGDGTAWAEHTVDGDFNRAFSVHAADVDRDGDIDVLGAAYSDDDITWWENTAGDGTAWTEHIIDGNFNGADSVYTADVDGDGDLDVLGAADIADDITWWENQLVIPSDFDDDGDVDFEDLKKFTEHWLDTGCVKPYGCEGTDLDNNTNVDFCDFTVFASDWWLGV